MSTNNATDTSKPVAISQGGTNAGSFTNTDGVVYYDGTTLNSTTVGTSGQVLTSNGSGMAPTFQTGGSGNAGMVLISSQNASSSASINFTSAITGTYDSYQIIFSNVVPATNNATLNMFVSLNNGSSWQGANYRSGLLTIPYNSATISTNGGLTNTIQLSGALPNTAGTGASGWIYIFNCNNGALFAANGQSVFAGATIGIYNQGPSTSGTGFTGVNAVQFAMSSGNITTGTFSLYGILE